MATRPVTHFVWQCLRTAKRAPTPPTGRQLRAAPTRTTRDGSFLTALVGEGLLVRRTGSAAAPFEATYALTPLGEHAAEYGEYDHNTRPDPPASSAPAAPTKAKPRRSR